MAFTHDDILTLAKAGFTAEQIAALNAVKAQQDLPQPAPAPAPEQNTAPEQVPAPVQAPVTPAPTALPIMAAPLQTPVQIPEQVAASTDDILKAINGLTATMQNGFLQGASQPTPPTAETILAEIINPPSKATK